MKLKLFGNRSNKSSSAKSKSAVRKRVAPFRAVKIVSRKNACTSAKKLADHPFLIDDAPLLPLKSCSNALYCDCRYAHIDDRRMTIRRDIDAGLPGMRVDTDRRTGDRRQSP